MGLQPLEFADCLTDSPFFRTKLAEHERELDRTSKFIKQLIHHGKDVYSAAKQFSKAQRLLAKDLMEFKFECIGNQLTDDEIFISKSLIEFGQFIEKIEESRDIVMKAAEDQFVKPLENFRKENIGAAKDEKKNFDKHTAKFCQSQEKYLKSTKVNDSNMQEADTQLEFEKKAFYTASMKYVLKLQEVQEKKKFEFVEILLSYMLGWLTFYHQGYVEMEEFRNYEPNLRHLLQKTRESFVYTRDEAQNLMSKMLNENKGLPNVGQWKPPDQSGTLKGFTRQGYLYVMEKKTLGNIAWTKYYCQYQKDTKEFYMILYNQMGGKIGEPEKFILDNCVRRAGDTIERRFCFDVTLKEKYCVGGSGGGPGYQTMPANSLKSQTKHYNRHKSLTDRSTPLTFQALSDEDRRQWLDAMDGKEPTYTVPSVKTEESMLDEQGFNFMEKCIATIETRGLDEQGLYRVVGVGKKVNSLCKIALDPKKAEKVNFEDPVVWETKTLTSAVKNYLRSLPEPLMTFQLHDSFIKAAKQESKSLRQLDIHKYVHQLPKANFQMLDMLIGHLNKVAAMSEENKMTEANLAVCFGPCLMRPEEETMAAVLDIKFCNIVVEILIRCYQQIFKTPPDGTDSDSRVSSSTYLSMNKPPAPQPPASPMDVSGPSPSRVSGQVTTNPTPRIYANQAPVHPSAPARLRQKPLHIVNSNTGGGETQGLTNNNSESPGVTRSSPSPRMTPLPPTPPLSDSGGWRGNGIDTNSPYANINALATKFNLNLSGNDSPAFGSVKKRNLSSDNSSSLTSSGMSTSLTGSLTGSSSSLTTKPPGRTVISRYRCIADNDTELSFEPNQLISNVRPSREPGWLEGSLDGKTGIIPENYVEFID